LSPSLTIIIPCYNEEEHIEKCLDSLLQCTFNRDQWEILVIDGMSNDRTREIVAQYAIEHPYVRLVDNPERIKPVALNKGIRESRGDYIMRIDAHSTYAPGYVDDLMDVASTHEVQNVGGIQVAIDESRGLWGTAIATAMSHPLAMGDAVHRMQFLKEPRVVDTVFCGCYPRQVFNDIGLFNEKLLRTQDREFNERLRASGGRILLIPSVHAYYKPRTNIGRHIRWIYDGARWLFFAGRHTDVPMIKPRNLVPMAFLAYLLVVAGVWVVTDIPLNSLGVTILLPLLFYLAVLAVAGIVSALQRSQPSLVIMLPIVVIVTHLAYGIGSIVGLVRRYA